MLKVNNKDSSTTSHSIFSVQVSFRPKRDTLYPPLTVLNSLLFLPLMKYILTCSAHLKLKIPRKRNLRLYSIKFERGKLGQNKIFLCFNYSGRWYFPKIRWAIWLRMLIYITAQISWTIHFSFPLLRSGPPPYSFNSVRMKECCNGSLAERLLRKEEKF